MCAMDELNESARRFSEKKNKCLKFVENAEKLATEYERDFPLPEKQHDKEAGTVGKAEIFRKIGEKLRNDRLKILVAGQFKQGKSTLINALLGEEVLPAYATPCTAVITEIAYATKKRRSYLLKSKSRACPQEYRQKQSPILAIAKPIFRIL